MQQFPYWFGRDHPALKPLNDGMSKIAVAGPPGSGSTRRGRAGSTCDSADGSPNHPTQTFSIAGEAS